MDCNTMIMMITRLGMIAPVTIIAMLRMIALVTIILMISMQWTQYISPENCYCGGRAVLILYNQARTKLLPPVMVIITFPITITGTMMNAIPIIMVPIAAAQS